MKKEKTGNLLIITPERVGVFNLFTGPYVLEFDGENPCFEILREHMAELTERT